MKCGANLSFGKQHVKTVLYNMLCAANFISSANVMHRDLKPANILINRFCQVKFCDFGLSRTLPESLADKQKQSLSETSDAKRSVKKTRCLSSHISSRWFRSPEIILIEKEYDQGIDIWSLGCILYELLLFSLASTNPELVPTKVNALFPGDHCYPLTPKNPKKSNEDTKDQLRTILETLGPQNDLSFIESKAGQQFVEGIQKTLQSNTS
jgi:mitogen-activated protein kinase 1/3